jgi:hypothetical protein
MFRPDRGIEPPAALRARFGWPPERPCATVDGGPFRGGQMSITLQGFGDFRWAEGIPRAEYAVQLPVAYLLEVMEREHPGRVPAGGDGARAPGVRGRLHAVS